MQRVSISKLAGFLAPVSIWCRSTPRGRWSVIWMCAIFSRTLPWLLTLGPSSFFTAACLTPKISSISTFSSSAVKGLATTPLAPPSLALAT